MEPKIYYLFKRGSFKEIVANYKNWPFLIYDLLEHFFEYIYLFQQSRCYVFLLIMFVQNELTYKRVKNTKNTVFKGQTRAYLSKNYCL